MHEALNMCGWGPGMGHTTLGLMNAALPCVLARCCFRDMNLHLQLQGDNFTLALMIPFNNYSSRMKAKIDETRINL